MRTRLAAVAATVIGLTALPAFAGANTDGTVSKNGVTVHWTADCNVAIPDFYYAQGVWHPTLDLTVTSAKPVRVDWRWEAAGIIYTVRTETVPAGVGLVETEDYRGSGDAVGVSPMEDAIDRTSGEYGVGWRVSIPDGAGWRGVATRTVDCTP